MIKLRCSFSVSTKSIPKVHDYVRKSLCTCNIAEGTLDDIVLASDEIATNIVEHAYKLPCNASNFSLSMRVTPEKIVVTFFDHGESFDLTKVPSPNIGQNLAGHTKGGFGIFLIRRLMDKMIYSAREKLNITRIVKEL